MANEQNLIPFNKRSESEHRAIAQRGGKASGEARSFKKLLSEIGKECASEKSQMEKKEFVARKLYELAGKGNLKAIELLMRVLNELDDNVTLTINQPRDLTPEEAAALQKHLEENYECPPTST